MPSISTFLRSLGNDGALLNVRTVLDDRKRDDWLIAGLALRLDEWDRAIRGDHERQAGHAA